MLNTQKWYFMNEKQKEYIKTIYVWIEQRTSKYYRAWMLDKNKHWDVAGYITDGYSTGEECLHELEEKYGKEIIKEMNIIIHTPEMKEITRKTGNDNE